MEMDRLSILRKIENGEMSIEEAILELEKLSLEPELPRDIIKPAQDQPEADKVSEEKITKDYIPTRQERKTALAERFEDWKPQMMTGLPDEKGLFQWPWEDKEWQWMWQNLDYPIFVNQSLDAREGTDLQVVTYHGNLYVRGWEKSELMFNAGVFDLRIGQDKNETIIAASTGELHIWMPRSILNVKAQSKGGDMFLANLYSNVEADCQSGDLGCENINGNVKTRVAGGDMRLVNIRGIIDLNANRGKIDVRNIISNNVNLKAIDGDISINMESFRSGSLQCETDDGDINLFIRGDLACDLLLEARKDGKIAPINLPWRKLMEHSQQKIHGILKDGGASVGIVTDNGRIYIQKSWAEAL